MAGAMTLDGNLVPAGQRYRVRTSAERERAFVAAAAHTKLVAILRRSLPIVAVAVLAAYFVSTHLSVTVGDMTASISGIEIADGNLRMTNPTLKGADKQNGNYVISADYADQDVKNPKIVKLNAIKADVLNPSGGWSRVNATRGVFNTQEEELEMLDGITVATSSGIQGELESATLDMRTQTLNSKRPVAFDLPNGRITARGMTLLSAESELTFRGKVKVHLVKPPKEEGAKPVASSTPGTEAAPPPKLAAPAIEPPALPLASGAELKEGGIPELPPMPQ